MAEARVDQLPRTPGLLEIDEGLVAEGRQRDVGAAGQRMIFRADGNEVLAGDHLGGDAARRLDQRHDGEVDCAGPDLVDEVVGIALAEAHLDTRIELVERSEQGRQVDEGRQALHRADGKASARQSLHGGDSVARLPHRFQGEPRLVEKDPAGGGELHLAGIAHEQLGGQFVLKGADRRRQGRLHDVDATGSAGEVHLLGDGDEMLQLA